MSRINRPPQGLQPLLGSQNFGDNPSELAQAVAPTLDMLPFYGSGILRLKRSSGSLAGEGEITTITFDDLVAVLSVAGWNQAGQTVAGQCNLGLAISGPPSDSLPVDQPHILAAGEQQGSKSANAQSALNYSFPAPIVIEPGTTFHLYWIENQPNNADTVQLTVMYYDLSEA